MYIKEDLETMLKSYNKKKAQVKELEFKKEEYEERLYYAGKVHEENKDEVIEGMQLSSKGVSEIPHSNTNKISDKTYNTAINYKKEMKHINRENRSFLERKISEIKEEQTVLKKEVERVTNLLSQLSVEEAFIIDMYYINNTKWDYVSQQYVERFKKTKTINQLILIRNNALNSMLDTLNVLK